MEAEDMINVSKLLGKQEQLQTKDTHSESASVHLFYRSENNRIPFRPEKENVPKMCDRTISGHCQTHETLGKVMLLGPIWTTRSALGTHRYPAGTKQMPQAPSLILTDLSKTTQNFQ